MSGNGSLTLQLGYKLTNQIQNIEVLSGANTYAGPTTVRSGTLQVTGSLANNGSNSVFVSAGSDFTSAEIIRRIQSGGSYSGFGAASTGTGLGSLADLRAGQNSSAAPLDVAMQYRVRNSGDAPRGLPGLISDALNLTGISKSIGTNVQTDPFVLQMIYDPTTLIGRETGLAMEGAIFLGWLDPSQNQPFGLWENATMGNFGSGLPGDVFQNVQSSWDAFAAANGVTDANVGNFLGSYGVDVAHHTVWAVVNHNSQFAAVPEPASWALIAIGTMLIAALRKAARKTRISSADSAD